MHTIIPTVLALIVTTVSSHDVIVGQNTNGRKIFDEKREANPAIWRQTQNVTVNTTDNEVISRIVVTDLRPEKDGDIKVIDGGEGQKNVTLELKSPTALRGYDFHIEVFAVPDNNQKVAPTGSENNKPEHPAQTRVQRNSDDLPNGEPNFDQPRTNFDGTTKLPELSSNIPVSVAKDKQRQTRDTEKKNEDITTPRGLSSTDRSKLNPPATVPESRFGNTPIITGNPQTRNNRDTETEKQNNNERTDIPRISIANNNPRIIPPYVLNRNNENATNNPDITGKINNEQQRYTRDTQDQNRPDENENPTNRGADQPFVPSTIGRNVENVTNNPVKVNIPRITRDAQSDGKSFDGTSKTLVNNDQKPILPPGVSGNIENTKQAPLNKENRNTRDANDHSVNTQRTVDNNGQHPSFAPANVGRNIENATHYPTFNNQPRNTREAQSQDETNNPRIRVENKPIIPSNFGRNIENATNAPLATNNDKTRNARDTRAEKDINAPRTQTENKPNIPNNAGRNFERSTLVPAATNKARSAREAQNEGISDQNINTPRSSINNDQKLNPPNIADKNSENVTYYKQIRNSRDAQNDDLKNTPQKLPINEPKSLFNANNPSSTVGFSGPSTDSPRNAREAQDDRPEIPPAFPSGTFNQNSDPKTPLTFQVNTHPFSVSTKTNTSTEPASTTTGASTARSQQKRDTVSDAPDLVTSDDKNDKDKKNVPKILGAPNASRPQNIEPVISIQ